MLYLINILIVFRPRTLPKNYDVDFAKDLEDDPGKIYKLKIELNSDGEVIDNDLTYNEIRKIKKKRIPIVVLGPIFNQEKNNNNFEQQHIFINSVDNDKDMNRIYTNLNIGFYE
mgnify:FL=1